MRYRAPCGASWLAATALLAGCASAPSPFHSESTAPRVGLLAVENDHWEALTIYIDRNGSLFRLGVVEGNDDARFRIPSVYLPADCWVGLVAMQTGGRIHAASEPFSLTAGQSARWQIALTSGPSMVSIVRN